MNPQANETHKQRIHAIASVTQGAPSNEKGAGARRAFPTLLLAAFFAALLMALISGVYPLPARLYSCTTLPSYR